MQNIEFRLNIEPPTVTAQEKKVARVGGRTIFYDPPALKKAKEQLQASLKPNVPAEPLTGPLELSCIWEFKAKSHKAGEWRSTRPDTDNLQKALKDCMTRCGFWTDDAQVVRETCEKKWSDNPGITISIKTL